MHKIAPRKARSPLKPDFVFLEPRAARRDRSLRLARALTVAPPILLIGAYELLRRYEMVQRVVINEAIEIVKSFCGADGYQYVNGVLDRLAAKASG